MFRQVIVDDQCIHTVIHEPFAHSRAREWRQVLVGGGVGGRRSNNCAVGHGPGFLENSDDASDSRLFVSYRDVDAKQRTIVFITGSMGSVIKASLTDDRVDANGGLARGAIS